eukprot:CAMPEP_0116976638 /NCGR_PEP_ID=MMETSP0467-20121206/56628_1 /TAXON_ID=283647 /ORGANISM="Mesodinium pulex, Strain SPMC105" /LENGTH=124 /DNA_ID=CAMNT_0004669501 /DNA_START=292 /DNA_END=666 /DNA_ORIENTATION=-
MQIRDHINNYNYKTEFNDNRETLQGLIVDRNESRWYQEVEEERKKMMNDIKLRVGDGKKNRKVSVNKSKLEHDDKDSQHSFNRKEKEKDKGQRNAMNVEFKKNNMSKQGSNNGSVNGNGNARSI